MVKNSYRQYHTNKHFLTRAICLFWVSVKCTRFFAARYFVSTSCITNPSLPSHASCPPPLSSPLRFPVPHRPEYRYIDPAGTRDQTEFLGVQRMAPEQRLLANTAMSFELVLSCERPSEGIPPTRLLTRAGARFSASPWPRNCAPQEMICIATAIATALETFWLNAIALRSMRAYCGRYSSWT